MIAHSSSNLILICFHNELLICLPDQLLKVKKNKYIGGILKIVSQKKKVLSTVGECVFIGLKW